MNIAYVYSAATMVGASAFGTWSAVRLWRRGPPYGGRVWPLWGWGPASWHACLRSMPLISAFCWLGTIAAVYSLLLLPVLGINDEGAFRVVLILVGLMGASILLIASVAFFNWPRQLVPPAMRHDRGAVVEWWEERAKRRRGQATQRNNRP